MKRLIGCCGLAWNLSMLCAFFFLKSGVILKCKLKDWTKTTVFCSRKGFKIQTMTATSTSRKTTA